MTLQTNTENGKITIKAQGWLDTQSAPLLGEKFDEITQADEIVLDFEELEYISSSGLRMVVAGFKKAKELNAKFKVINAGNEVMDVFKLTNLDKKIDISVK